jgi:hypothetical protein
MANVDLESPTSLKVLLKDEWNDLLAFVFSFFFDALKTGLVFFGLLLFEMLFDVGRYLHIPEHYVVAFARIHFWLSVGLYIIVGVDFLLKLVLDIFRRRRRG